MARVSGNDQSLDPQLDVLQSAGCDQFSAIWPVVPRWIGLGLHAIFSHLMESLGGEGPRGWHTPSLLEKTVSAHTRDGSSVGSPPSRIGWSVNSGWPAPHHVLDGSS
jgi:hypothetical protein